MGLDDNSVEDLFLLKPAFTQENANTLEEGRIAPSVGDQIHPRAGNRKKCKITTSVSMSSWSTVSVLGPGWRPDTQFLQPLDVYGWEYCLHL